MSSGLDADGVATDGASGPSQSSPGKSGAAEIVTRRIEKARTSAHLQAIRTERRRFGIWRRGLAGLSARLGKLASVSRNRRLPPGNLLFAALFAVAVAVIGLPLPFVPAAVLSSLLLTYLGVSWSALAAIQGLAMLLVAGAYLLRYWPYYF